MHRRLGYTNYYIILHIYMYVRISNMVYIFCMNAVNQLSSYITSHCVLIHHLLNYLLTYQRGRQVLLLSIRRESTKVDDC